MSDRVSVIVDVSGAIPEVVKCGRADELASEFRAMKKALTPGRFKLFTERGVVGQIKNLSDPPEEKPKARKFKPRGGAA